MNKAELEGQLLATQAALHVLISRDPNPAEAASAVQRAIQGIVSTATLKALPDAYISGLIHAQQLIAPPRE